MRRRGFIAGLSAVVSYCLARSTAATEQPLRLVGALLVESAFDLTTVERVLKQHGWTPGQDVRVEARVSNGDTDQARMYARELISLKPNVLFAVTNTSMAALYAERSTIPTVFAMVSDPVGMHYVESFSRPGRNVTGFTPFEPSLGGKWVSLLKEVAPKVQHLGLIYNPAPGNNSAAFRKSIDDVAGSLGIVSIETPSGSSSGIERLILTLRDEPSSGLIFLPDAYTSVEPHRSQIIALIARSQLPAIYPLRIFCASGGLMSYGVDRNKIIEGAASYVDRILRGANPAELPVQAPTRFELVLNQRTAKQLGLELPPLLLADADEVIE
jgi:putative ABC transport system substrate-binding protein